MKKMVMRRLEALEKEHHSRELKEQSSFDAARIYIWKIVLAYYLGDLKPDDPDCPAEMAPSQAEARALHYPSESEFYVAICKCDIEILKRYTDAYRRLFAKAGLDFDTTQPNLLFDAFTAMVNQLPDQWLSWLRSKFRERCRDVELEANLPRRLSGNNFLLYAPFEEH
jgi:hypothetical protein